MFGRHTSEMSSLKENNFFAVLWNLFPIFFSSLFMYFSCWYPLTEKVHSLPLKQQTHEKLSSKRFFLLQRKYVIWERTILDIFFFTVNMIFCCCNETKAFVRKRSHVKVIMQKVFFSLPDRSRIKLHIRTPLKYIQKLQIYYLKDANFFCRKP